MNRASSRPQDMMQILAELIWLKRGQGLKAPSPIAPTPAPVPQNPCALETYPRTPGYEQSTESVSKLWTHKPENPRFTTM